MQLNIKRVSSILLLVLMSGLITSPAHAVNLITNPNLNSFELKNSPSQWQFGNYGDNNARGYYPVSGFSGGTDKAGKVQITRYTDGDAKWHFKDVPVVEGVEYTFSNHYIADTVTDVIVRFQSPAGTFMYQDLGSAPVALNWQSFKQNFTVPPGVKSVTVLHILKSVGSLTVDDYFLGLSGDQTSNPTDILSEGMVSVAFDDGWLSQYENGHTILKDANIKATFFIISKSMLKARPIDDTLRGKMDRSYAWQSRTVAVNGGQAFSFAADIKSDSSGYIRAKYLNNNDVTQEDKIKTFDDKHEGTLNADFIVPANTTSLQLSIVLDNSGELKVNKSNLRDLGLYMTTQHVLDLQSDGHEIGAHSQTHPDLTSIPAVDAQVEIFKSGAELSDAGIKQVRTFGYPYGAFNQSVKQMVNNAGFKGARSVEEGYNNKSADIFALKGYEVDKHTTFESAQSRVTTAIANKTWVILYFHQIDNSGSEFSASPEMLRNIVTYLKESNVKIVTIDQGIDIVKQNNTRPVLAPLPVAANIPSGDFSQPFTVMLSSENAHRIQFTTDGSPATCDAGRTYAGPFVINFSTTIHAVGCNTDSSSSESTFTYKDTKWFFQKMYLGIKIAWEKLQSLR